MDSFNKSQIYENSRLIRAEPINEHVEITFNTREKFKIAGISYYSTILPLLHIGVSLK